ncbi:hypothetical protein JOL62DRAFT_18180 [Phyllosticta paracitricarpa]|uniref:Uncharacterized protein n=1 Tax=Phyllosticta paracitricarpa TaxID=2016321 RepID=A0ABR1NAQ0_9PEZI
MEMARRRGRKRKEKKKAHQEEQTKRCRVVVHGGNALARAGNDGRLVQAIHPPRTSCPATSTKRPTQRQSPSAELFRRDMIVCLACSFIPLPPSSSSSSSSSLSSSCCSSAIASGASPTCTYLPTLESFQPPCSRCESFSSLPINSARASICPGRSLGSPVFCSFGTTGGVTSTRDLKRASVFYSPAAYAPRTSHSSYLRALAKKYFYCLPACMLLRSRELTAYATWLSARLVPLPQELELPCAPQRTNSP